MNITGALLSLPYWLLLVLLMAFFAGVNVLITHFMRPQGPVGRFLRIKVMASHNEITGYLFAVVAGFYALLLAFVVFQALGEADDVQTDSDREGSLAKSLYRQVIYYPDSADALALKKEYVNYAGLVVREEYPKMAQMEKSDTTVNSFSRVFEIIEQLKPAEPNTQAKAQVMFQTMNELATYRSLRILAAGSEIPVIIWLVLILGGLINSMLAAMMDVENRRYHLFVNSLMGAFIGLIFFLIIILDHPFTGSIKVMPTGYTTIIATEEKAAAEK